MLHAEENIRLAHVELDEAELIQSTLQEARTKKAIELELMVEKMHSHVILQEKIKRLESQEREYLDVKKIEEISLAEIRSSKKRLIELEPKLERRKEILARLEYLEPKRAIYEKTSRQIAAARASIEGAKKALDEGEKRLLDLNKDAALFEELKPREKEYSNAQSQFDYLVSQRDKFSSLKSNLNEDIVRMEVTNASISRVQMALEDLHKAKARLEHIQPAIQEEKRLKSELEELSNQREKQRMREDLFSRKAAIESRKVRLIGETEKASQELEELGDLEAKEKELRRQDRELDSLATELNRILADLRSSLKAEEQVLSQAQSNLKKVNLLGAKGFCPTCERPLEGQSDLLREKYTLALTQAGVDIKNIQARIVSETENINGVTTSRSNLGKAFDDLNSKKGRRSALDAHLGSLARQISESQSELNGIQAEIEALGDVVFDLKKQANAIDVHKRLILLVEECRSLAIRLEDLPRQSSELNDLQEKKEFLQERCDKSKRQITALGYAESEYLDTRKKLAELKPQHDRFLSLSLKVKDIPVQEENISRQRLELDRFSRCLQELNLSLQLLGFDPTDYESMVNEQRLLFTIEEEAQKIRQKVGHEHDVQRRLAQVIAALSQLEMDLTHSKGLLVKLEYSPKEHEAVRFGLDDAEKKLDLANMEITEMKVQMGVLKSRQELLVKEAQRKKEHEKTIAGLYRKMEIVDTTKNLVNGFMGQVLIRVKNEIAKTASEILDEVSGKYCLLKIDDDFNILVEDGGEFYPITRYSGGEIDMIAVSVRVAISEYLMRFGPDGESYSFLILDEVFGSQDIEHREKMIQMLRSLEARFPQIIAISHISDVQGQFDNTLQVVEDEIGNSRVETF